MLKVEPIKTRFCVVGGGMAGVVAALAAARRGLDTVLVTDRPVLGGNASKEIRVWITGADGGANNRWFRETGILEELRLENLHRNPTGNAEEWDALLTEKVLSQPHLRVFLNTVVAAAGKSGKKIDWVEGFQLASERRLRFSADFFADCTGDGTVGFLAGARFMRGRESRSRFGESLAPKKAPPRTMGGTIMFSVRKAGKPVPFIPPAFAHKFTRRSFRWRQWLSPQGGCSLWWVEYGGMLDTIRDNERVKHELWSIVWGLWDYLKNSPQWRERTRDLELTWVGTIPGKRESRRLRGDHIFTQNDAIDRPHFPDAVAYGGWSIDDHPSDGFYSKKPPSDHYYLPGIFNIPLRSLYSADVPNLFLAGRDASLSHQGLCATRVMATCAQMGEAVGAAAALAVRRRVTPRAIATGPLMAELQQDLIRADHHIIGVKDASSGDLSRVAMVTASSSRPAGITPTRETVALDRDHMLMFPVAGGRVDSVSLWTAAKRPATLRYALHGPGPFGLFLPGPEITAGRVAVPRGKKRIGIPLAHGLFPGFYWLMLARTPGVSLSASKDRVPGVATMARTGSVGTDYKWRNDYSEWGRPRSPNIAFSLSPKQFPWGAAEAVNGFFRPWLGPNLWVSGPGFPQWLKLEWDRARQVRLIQLRFDTDLDQALPHLWVDNGRRAMESCIRDYRLVGETVSGRRVVLAAVRDNHQRLREHPVRGSFRALRIEVLASHGSSDARLYGVRIY